MTGEPTVSPTAGATVPALAVQGLTVDFPGPNGTVHAVGGLDLTVDRGRMLGIAGESGSGKSAACLAMMGLHVGTTARVGGSIRVAGQEVVGAPESRLRAMRGAVASMVFQDPLSALHPFHTVGAQIAEARRAHGSISRRAARRDAIEMLDRVGIADANRRSSQYPHQFSGGMRQRVMIAMAMCTGPALLIADEPTTALDVTVQAQILALMRELSAERGTSIVLVSHDLAVLAQLADDLLIMYAGTAVEYGPAADVLARPGHPYSWGLLGSVVRVDGPRRARLRPIPGSAPGPARMPPGCAFAPRCLLEPLTAGRARAEAPPLVESGDGHPVACHLPADRRRAALAQAERTGGPDGSAGSNVRGP